MGILNVTPDSFSDGGSNLDHPEAVESGLRMFEEGADLVDVGGESTRPGADPVDIREEISRTQEVVHALAEAGVPVSIDTMKPQVAAAALDAGAFLVNDVSGLRDPDMVELVQSRRPFVCIMHMRGEPRTMQVSPMYGDVVREVREYLIHAAMLLDLPSDQVWIDPGIGFGKNVEHNLSLLARLDEFVGTGFPVLIGTSRKSFIGKLLPRDGEQAAPDDRLEGTLATQIWAQTRGVAVIRAHDVLSSRRALDMVAEIQNRLSRS